MSVNIELLKESFRNHSEEHFLLLKKKISDIKYVYTKVDFKKPEGERIFKKVTREEDYVSKATAYRKSAEEYINELQEEIAALQERNSKLKKEATFWYDAYMQEIEETQYIAKLSISLISKNRNGEESK